MKLLLITLTLSTFANQSFRVGRMSSRTTSIEYAQVIIEKVYTKLGIEHSFVKYPHNRSIYLLETGETDSEVCRYGDFEEKYKNLIKVTPPIITSGVAIYYKKEELKDINTLKKIKKYSVGSMQGAGYTKKLNKFIDSVDINRIESLFKMIQQNRIDFIAFPEIEFQEKIKEYKLKRLYIPEVDIHLKCHHYINIRHKKIAPLISKELEKHVKQN